MSTMLPPDTIVQIVKAGTTGGEMSPVRCLHPGEIIIHQGARYRVLAAHKLSGKAMVEPHKEAS